MLNRPYLAQIKVKKKIPLKWIVKENKRAFLVLIIFSLAFSTFSSALTVQAQSVQEVVNSVENHYGMLKTLTAKVTQINRLKAVGMTQKFDGTLWIEKPGKLRLNYTNGQVLVIDGKAVLFYSRKNEQLIKKTFTDFQLVNIPVAFLLGAAHIRDDFDVLQSDPKTPRSLELLPKKSEAAMNKLIMASDPDGRITSLTIFDKSGNIAEIVFTQEEDNATFDNKLFTFKIPKGTEVIEQ